MTYLIYFVVDEGVTMAAWNPVKTVPKPPGSTRRRQAPSLKIHMVQNDIQ